MKIISRPRRTGKTTMLVEWAVLNNGTIIVPTQQHRATVIAHGQRTIRSVPSEWWDAHVQSAREVANRPVEGPVAVDELDAVLDMLFRRTPVLATITEG